MNMRTFVDDKNQKCFFKQIFQQKDQLILYLMIVCHKYYFKYSYYYILNILFPATILLLHRNLLPNIFVTRMCSPQFLLRLFGKRLQVFLVLRARWQIYRFIETDIIKTLKAHTSYSKYLQKHVILHVTILPITIITFRKYRQTHVGMHTILRYILVARLID